MDGKLALMSGVGLGAGMMFMLDPRQGRQRRGVVRDKVRSYVGRSGDVIGRTSRDMSHRAHGLAAGLRGRLRHEGVADEVLAERVRSRLGRCASHPRAIEVDARDGRVVLSGAVLGFELDHVLAAVARVRGVREVQNRLDAYDEPSDVPELHVGVFDDDGEPFSRGWSPALRALAGAAGGGLALYGLKRKDPLGAALGTLGVGLLLRGLGDVDLRRVLGRGGDEVVEIQKTIHLSAPVGRVFEVWSNYQNFPRFLSRVREVRDMGQGRSHWVGEGPAGIPVEWDAVLTAHEPDELIAWESLPSAAIANLGRVRFAPDAEGGTRVEVFLSYCPPGGEIGDAAAALFGAEPGHQIDEDLLRMKTFVEAQAADPAARAYEADRPLSYEPEPSSGM